MLNRKQIYVFILETTLIFLKALHDYVEDDMLLGLLLGKILLASTADYVI